VGTTVSDLLKEKKSAYSAAELAARFRVEMFDVLHERQMWHWGHAGAAHADSGRRIRAAQRADNRSIR
jgi:hypothetical protein